MFLSTRKIIFFYNYGNILEYSSPTNNNLQEELVSGFSQFLDGDYGQGYRQQADYAFQNKDYIQ